MGDIFYLEGDYNYGRLNKILDGWRGKLDFYSIIYGGAVHLADLIIWLTGKKVVEVFTYGNDIITSNTNFKYNDFAVSLLKFEDKSIAKISSNFGCIFPHFHGLLIYGSKATFINDFEYGLFILLSSWIFSVLLHFRYFKIKKYAIVSEHHRFHGKAFMICWYIKKCFYNK